MGNNDREAVLWLYVTETDQVERCNEREKNKRTKALQDVALGQSAIMEMAFLDANLGLTKLWLKCACV